MTTHPPTLQVDPINPSVIHVHDQAYGRVGSYAWNTATGPGVYQVLCVGGWTSDKIREAVEAVYKKAGV